CTEVRKGRGHPAKTYLELAKKIAELQFMNRDYVLLFRGQNIDVRNRQGNTSLKPTLFRETGGNPSRGTLIQRFARLERAESHLVRLYQKKGYPGIDRMKRQQILRWSLLQHY